jgi:hypothetical protein
MQQFYVDETWRGGPHKAVIHESSCERCGKRMVGERDETEAKWHGPFSTFGAATSASVALKNVISRTVCMCVRNAQGINAERRPPSLTEH